MKNMMCLVSAMLFAVTAFAADETSNVDPYEPLNRAIFEFNETLDKFTLKPVAQAYDKVTPSVLNVGISNAFKNAAEVRTMVNSGLQGKLKNAGSSTLRLLVNSTLGMGGLFDVASRLGVKANSEDFGQTLGVWGVKKGPYLMLPFLGSSTVRGVAAIAPDMALNPINYYNDFSSVEKSHAVRIIDVRAGLLEKEQLIIGDRYEFIRDYYLNQIEKETHGQLSVPEVDDFVE